MTTAHDAALLRAEAMLGRVAELTYHDAQDIVDAHCPVPLDPECQWYLIAVDASEIGPEGECDAVWDAFCELAALAGVGPDAVDFVSMWDGERLRVVFAVERAPVVQLRLW